MFPGSCLQCFMWHSTRRAPAYGKPRAARLRLSDSGVVAGPTLVCFIGLQSAWRWHQFRRHAGGKRATEGAGGGGGVGAAGSWGMNDRSLIGSRSLRTRSPKHFNSETPDEGERTKPAKRSPGDLSGLGSGCRQGPSGAQPLGVPGVRGPGSGGSA